MMKARCNKCHYLDYDVFTDSYHFGVWDNRHRCGLHGCAEVDPEGEQPNLDRHGSCGFMPIYKPRQLRLF